jgi:hypothetical protein
MSVARLQCTLYLLLHSKSLIFIEVFDVRIHVSLLE